MAIFVYIFHNKSYDFRFLVHFKTSLSIISILSISYLLFFNHTISEDYIAYTIGDKISNLKFHSIYNEYIDTSERKVPFLLIIFFDTKKDCSFCLTEFSLWQKIYEDYHSNIQVIGVGYAPSNSFMHEWAYARKLKFPIILDEKKNIINKYNFPTPMKVLIDSHNQIVEMQKSSGNIKSQMAFIKEMENKINKKK